MLISASLTHLAGAVDTQSGSGLAEAIWGLAYALAIVGVIREREFSFPLIRKSLPLLAIVALAILSTLWSDNSLLTLRRAFGLFGTTAIAFYVVSRYSLAAFLDTLVLTINAIALISIPLIIFVPEIGLMQGAYQGAFRGLFWEKNKFGETMGIGIVTMLAMLHDSRGRQRLKLWISMVGCLVLVVGSRSATPLVALFVVLCCLSVMFRFRKKKIGFAAFALCAVLAVFVLLANAIGLGPDDILGLFGRDATFTGRNEVWTTATQYISQRPALGYGYQVFWEPDGPVMRYLQKDLGWEPVSAHQGFLEIMLDFGVAGLILIVIFLIEGLRRALRFFRSSDDHLSAWPLLAILALTIMNFADATFALYNELLWLTLMIAFLYATAGYQSATDVAEADHDIPGGLQPQAKWTFG